MTSLAGDWLIDCNSQKRPTNQMTLTMKQIKTEITFLMKIAITLKRGPSKMARNK